MLTEVVVAVLQVWTRAIPFQLESIVAIQDSLVDASTVDEDQMIHPGEHEALSSGRIEQISPTPNAPGRSLNLPSLQKRTPAVAVESSSWQQRRTWRGLRQYVLLTLFLPWSKLMFANILVKLVYANFLLVFLACRLSKSRDRTIGKGNPVLVPVRFFWRRIEDCILLFLFIHSDACCTYVRSGFHPSIQSHHVCIENANSVLAVLVLTVLRLPGA
jgi:hypothetical protein